MKLQSLMSLIGLYSIHAQNASAVSTCRCTPKDTCWPSQCAWDGLDKLLGAGKLIKNKPIARFCYDGPDKDLEKCAYVDHMWTDENFHTQNPVGRPLPYNITCPPVDYSSASPPDPGACLLGSLPVYTVNATSVEDVASTLEFAKLNNIRLVVTSTGHDMLGRSDGYGAIEIWLRHFRHGIDFQTTYQPFENCADSGWKGSAIQINGGYQWHDVYKVAKANNVIVVGGGATSVGAVGGWASGGGHGPATHNYGLGADQILEMEVMLADGAIVVANHCQNTDLFRALRGGGPGYGIVLRSTVKAYPNVDTITVHSLAMAPIETTPQNRDLLDAIAVLVQSYPGLINAGFSGNARWFRNFHAPFIGNASSGYVHGIWTIGKNQTEADASFAPVRRSLEAFQSRLSIFESFRSYTDYWSFYEAESGIIQPAGDTALLTSRLIDPPAVEDYNRVREAIEVVGGTDDEFVANIVILVGGGQVFKDVADKTSGLHPAWRRAPFALMSGRGVPRTASNEMRKAVTDDVTFVKGAALKKLAPTTGGYMNEGDRNDPEWKQTFFGSNYASHLAAKNKYDPENLFYCTGCVGSDLWVERPDGPLCPVELPEAEDSIQAGLRD